MQKISVYTVTHKEFNPIAGKCYVPIHVGAETSNLSIPYIKDNSGDNISEENNQFCELTGQYWVWKNDLKSEIVGLVHYRRYFLEQSFPKKTIADNILHEATIAEILADYDVILPYPAHKLMDNMIMYHKEERQSNEWLSMLRSVICDKYSYYLDSYDKVAFGYRISFGNMFISKKEIFDSYSEWLFSVLNDYRNLLETKEICLPPRHLGYMAEYLLNTYFWANNSKVKYLQVVNVETNSSAYIKAKMFLSKIGLFQVFLDAWHFAYRIINKF